MWDWMTSYGAWLLTVVGGTIALIAQWIIDDERKPAMVNRVKWFMRGGLLCAIMGGGLSGYHQLASEWSVAEREAEKSKLEAQHRTKEKRS